MLHSLQRWVQLLPRRYKMSLIENIKNHIPILDVVENYTELRGGGNRLRAKENPLREGGDLDIYQDTQKYYDQGTGEGGDVIDFIQIVENISKNEALTFLQEKYLNGVDLESSYIKPIPRNKPIKKDNDLLLVKLETMANKYLHASHKRYKNKWSYMTLDIDGVETEVVRVAPYLEKLFEGYLIPTDEKFAKYLFSRVIGYCEYFNCPVIILRDESETVVDIIKYRPERNGKPLMQGNKPLKYLNLKSEERPDNSYLFPLQAQMQLIAQNLGVAYVGEGLKNAINASIMGVPFISIEGAGSIKPELISFLKSNRMNGIKFIGAFDGDPAGEQAYKRVNAEIPMRNKFSFDGGMDFADYLKQIRTRRLNVG